MEDGSFVCHVGQRIGLFVVHDFGLKETGDGENKREKSHGRNVFNNSFGEGVGLVHSLAVVDGVVDCDEPLDRNGDGHEDWTSENDLGKGPEEIGKEDNVNVCD